MTDRRPADRHPSIRLAAVIATALALLAPATASAAIQPALLTDGGGTAAAPNASTITLSKVADVPQPVLAIGARDGTNRLFIVTKGGRIRIVKNGNLLATPFLDIASSVSKGSEQGLLGLAFHPQFKTNHKYYINYTNTAGDTVIKEFRSSTSNPDVTQAGSGRTILVIDQPYSNHNGGMVAFGKDGYLYIGMGDGGSGGDPGGRGQSINTLLGKILRIGINGQISASKRYLIPSSNPYVGKPGRDEIWQRGTRNPWRFSFDRTTGDLWIGDVGQERYEEVDHAVRTSTGPGRGVNWGWRTMEGRHCYAPASGCSTAGKKLPLTEYAHGARCSISGGYVYRGAAIPALAGWYVYGDYCSGEVWAVSATASAPANGTLLLGQGSGRLVSGFGEDDAGELYLCDLNGSVYKIVAN